MQNPSSKRASLTKYDALRLLCAGGFLVLIFLFVNANYGGIGTHSTLLLIAAIVGGYMALNIGANDSANNVGPAVGAGALTLTGAIFIAVIFEASGALIAGGDVVNTIKKGIIDPAMIQDTSTFIWVMLAALLSAAIWVNIATFIGAPVSTTHSIVGGVMGAGIAAGGWGIADWDQVQKIVASWIISPAMGGIIAASFLYAIKRTVLYRTDMKSAAVKIVPILIGIMAWVFTTYIILKGLKKIITINLPTALGLGLLAAIIFYIIVRTIITKRAANIEGSKQGIDRLFTIPLIVSAAFLSFAHGSNDVANAIGPLAAIYEAARAGEIVVKAAIPLWVMLIGSIGIATGLALYGPKLIKTVGTEITELDKVRAFCVALAAAITVIIASQLGLPVSSTHIAVGGIFGVGFLREYLNTDYNQKIDKIRRHMREEENKDEASIEAFLTEFDARSLKQKKLFLSELKQKARDEEITWWERRRIKKAYKAKLVERSMLYKIIGAWIFTVPIAACLSAALFFMLRGMMLP